MMPSQIEPALLVNSRFTRELGFPSRYTVPAALLTCSIPEGLEVPMPTLPPFWIVILALLPSAAVNIRILFDASVPNTRRRSRLPRRPSG